LGVSVSLVCHDRAPGQGLLSYVRGLFGAIGLFARMLGKRKRVQSQRKLTNAQLIEKLRASETQIYSWYVQSDTRIESALLRIYFGLFGRP
jgi:hypothetical protein